MIFMFLLPPTRYSKYFPPSNGNKLFYQVMIDSSGSFTKTLLSLNKVQLSLEEPGKLYTLLVPRSNFYVGWPSSVILMTWSNYWLNFYHKETSPYQSRWTWSVQIMSMWPQKTQRSKVYHENLSVTKRGQVSIILRVYVYHKVA